MPKKAMKRCVFLMGSSSVISTVGLLLANLLFIIPVTSDPSIIVDPSKD